MPKGKIVNPNTRKMKTVKRKFKLGGRTSTTGAPGLSTPELLKRFEDTSRKRDRNKIQQVLQARGVMIAGKTAFGLIADSDLQTADNQTEGG